MLRVWPIRAGGVLLAAATAWYLPWLAAHVSEPWLGWPLVVATVLLVAAPLLDVVNNAQRAAPRRSPVPEGDEPLVAVLIPTAGESPDLVLRTAASVLCQDWPAERLAVLISDDAHSTAMRDATVWLHGCRPGARVHYLRPPHHGSALRRGDAKAGNLNAALEVLGTIAPGVAYVETRDADDEVGDPRFLREAVGVLRADRGLAYVQTIKEARVSPGDPFDNLQPQFYRGAMHARHAANAVFPCGSGLVWRRTALQDVRGFPQWNLVEDLQSGVEALRRGWRGAYLPIVGAVGQHSPEDLPNVHKQRGTWALDGMRLLLWRSLSGMSLRQRLHFWSIGLFYVQSFVTLAFVVLPVVAVLLGVTPIVAPGREYLAHFVPFTVAVEAMLLALHFPHGFAASWRSRELWAGLAPVYAKAVLLAVAWGPRRKPRYRVTRKEDRFAWYWRATLPHAVAVVAVAGCAGAQLAASGPTGWTVASLWWGGLYGSLLAGFVRKGWFGAASPASRAAKWAWHGSGLPDGLDDAALRAAAIDRLRAAPSRT